MIYLQAGNVIVRAMVEADAGALAEGFALQGWDKPREQFAGYLNQQQAGVRQVFVAEREGGVAGYVTLLPKALAGPFAGQGMPEISDFNVLMKYQRQGIGSLILDAAEQAASAFGDVVSLGVGLHSGYGSAQRMYVKRGYMPDGTGVWYQDKPLPPYGPCRNDDDLVLYFSKRLG